MRPARLAAGVMVAALAAGAAYAGSRTTPAPVPTSPPGLVPSSSSAPGTVAPTSSPSTVPSSVPDISDDPVDVAAEGLQAWGRFAVSGDLETLAAWFSTRGPQWARFEQEAPALLADPLGDPPYRVVFDPLETVTHAGRARVVAEVTFVRTGEPSQAFDWEILLRREDGRWRIWTVEERQPGSSPSMVRP